MEPVDKFAPYASPENVTRVFDRVRKGGVKKVDEEFLLQIGISDGMVARTRRALEFLGFASEDGTLTPLADRFVVATDEDAKSIIQDALRTSYDTIFRAIDPTTDARNKIQTAFRPMQPSGQWSRMVTLFLGLCAWTGMAVKDPPTDRPGKDAPPRERSAARATGNAKPRADRRRVAPAIEQPPPLAPGRPGGLDPALAGLVAKLADIKSSEDLEKWWVALKSTFEFVNRPT